MLQYVFIRTIRTRTRNAQYTTYVPVRILLQPGRFGESSYQDVSSDRSDHSITVNYYCRHTSKNVTKKSLPFSYQFLQRP